MADPHLTLSSLLLSLLKSAPQCKMTLVKREFERSPNGGLNLHDFMHALLTHLAMDVSEEKDKRIEEELEILVDDIERMFSQIDVDCKNSIRWEEFLGYMIDQSTAIKRQQQLPSLCYRLRQDYDIPCYLREPVHLMKWLPNYQRLLVCLGHYIRLIHLYLSEETAQGRLTCQLDLPSRDCPNDFGACDVCVLEGEDMLCALQTNLAVSFWNLPRVLVSSESISSAGCVALRNQPYLITWSASTGQLFTAGNDNVIHGYSLLKSFSADGRPAIVKLIPGRIFKGHKDVVQSFFFYSDRDGSEKLVSGGLDRQLICWNLKTGQPVKRWRGQHLAGIKCICYDSDSQQIYSGGYDGSLLVWDIYNGDNSPAYRFEQHTVPIEKIASAGNGHMCALDREGKLGIYDVRKSVTLDTKDRCVMQIMTPRDKSFKALELVYGATGGQRFSYNHLTIALGGSRINLYDAFDPRPPLGPPSILKYHAKSSTLLVVNSDAINMWDVTKGASLHEFHTGLKQSSLQQNLGDVTGLCLDEHGNKVIITYNGHCTMHSFFTGKNLRHFCPRRDGQLNNVCYIPELQYLIGSCLDKAVVIMDASSEVYANKQDPLVRLVENAHDEDMIALAYDNRLGLVVTASCDEIRYWDFEFLSLEGVVQASSSSPAASTPSNDTTRQLTGPSDLTTILFVSPWPVLAVGDQSGTVSLISTAKLKKRFSHTCISQFVAEGGPLLIFKHELERKGTSGRKGDAAGITCMVTCTDDNRKSILYVGNSKGVIRGFDITNLVSSTKPIANDERPCARASYNPKRKLHRDANAVSSIQPTSLHDVKEPNTCNNMLPKLAFSWIAHDDSILCMELIPELQVIFSSSQDHSIKVWSLTGIPLGVLTLGWAKDLQGERFWNFPACNNHEQQERHTSEEVGQHLLQELTLHAEHAKPSEEESIKPLRPGGSCSLLPPFSMTKSSNNQMEYLGNSSSKGTPVVWRSVILEQLNGKRGGTSSADITFNLNKSTIKATTMIKATTQVVVEPSTRRSSEVTTPYDHIKATINTQPKRRKKKTTRGGVRQNRIRRLPKLDVDVVVKNIKAVDKLLLKIQASKCENQEHQPVRLRENEENGGRLDALRRDHQQRHKNMYKYLSYAEAKTCGTAASLSSSHSAPDSPMLDIVEYLSTKARV